MTTDNNSNFFTTPVPVIERLDNNLYFTGEIDATSAHKFRYLLHEIEKERRDLTDKGCTIYINSNGGSCTAGLLMYDALRNSSLDITLIASGFVASSATIVMLGSDKRKCTANTTFLVHNLSTYVSGTLSYVRSNVAYSEMLLQQFSDIYSKYTKITKNTLEQETFLNAKQALDLQLVTEIM